MNGTQMSANPDTAMVVIALIGIVIGAFAIFILVRALGKVGGQVGTAFRLTFVGTIFQMSALFYNIITSGLSAVNIPLLGQVMTHDVHEALMVAGIFFFVLAAWQFSKLSQ